MKGVLIIVLFLASILEILLEMLYIILYVICKKKYLNSNVNIQFLYILQREFRYSFIYSYCQNVCSVFSSNCFKNYILEMFVLF